MDFLLLIPLFWIALCFVCSWVASQRGRSGPRWFFLALLLSPIVALIALVAAPAPRPGESRTKDPQIGGGRTDRPPRNPTADGLVSVGIAATIAVVWALLATTFEPAIATEAEENPALAQGGGMFLLALVVTAASRKNMRLTRALSWCFAICLLFPLVGMALGALFDPEMRDPAMIGVACFILALAGGCLWLARWSTKALRSRGSPEARA